MIKQETKLSSYLRDCVAAVDTELDKVLPSLETPPKGLHAAVRHSMFAGGKRFRPALAFAVGREFGVGFDKLRSVAAALEMVHTYSLIHDDLPSMDDDELRRGRPACHTQFGEATAILAGDVLQTLAFQVISGDEKLTADLRVRIIGEISKAAGSPLGMVAGQQLDLEAEGKAISVTELEAIHKKKTGAMIVASVRCGAIVSNASASELDALSAYASRLGLLFQITDDLLDVTQTTEVLGKTAGKDGSVEKATYPALYGIEQTRQLAGRVHKEARAELEKAGKSGFLSEIADYVLQREK